MRKMILGAATLLLSGLALGPASAHHSFAMFDMTKSLTLTGTVRTWEWTNPHTWLWLYVSDPATGKVTVWGLEGTAPGELVRQGWKRDIIKTGDKITVTIRPLRDGRPGGAMGKVVLPDGTSLGGYGEPKKP